MRYYHGGIAGLAPGAVLVPAPPHVDDDCPVCVARFNGRPFTVGEYRAWALSMGADGLRLLRMLEGAPSDALVDPPTKRAAVYLTTRLEYATWYAARSRGDLYRVEPIGDVEASTEDHFPTFVASSARVLEVLRRGVILRRAERRALEREWKKADARAAKGRVA